MLEVAVKHEPMNVRIAMERSRILAGFRNIPVEALRSAAVSEWSSLESPNEGSASHRWERS